MIISRTPFRVSFFGGGTDYPAWYRENTGQVLATTVDKYCYISCRYLPPFFKHKYRIVYSKIENVVQLNELEHPAVKATLSYLNCDKGLEIHHDGDLPARSGLGSSSAFTVGLLNALYALVGKYTSAKALAQEAIHIEQNIIKENVGSQDQILAAYGGFNEIKFNANDTFQVNPLVISAARLAELQQHCMLFFTGLSRFADGIAKSKIANFYQRQKQLTELGQMVEQAKSILLSPSTTINEFGLLLHQAWLHKKSLSNKVSNSKIDAIYEVAYRNGAVGGKLLGAGGGGFILLFVPPEYQERVKKLLKELVYVPFNFERGGSRIMLYQPNGWDEDKQLLQTNSATTIDQPLASVTN